jgi:hypothetical protein
MVLLLATIGVASVSYRNSINPSGIIIHHTAIPLPPDGSRVDVGLIEEIHRRRGFGLFYWGRVYHIGYHYLILPDGRVESGRPEHALGAHALGYNSWIGICLVGDFSLRDNPRGDRGPNAPTASQVQALRDLVAQLRGRYSIPPERVLRHRDVNADTECPGDNFPVQGLLDANTSRDLEEVGLRNAEASAGLCCRNPR